MSRMKPYSLITAETAGGPADLYVFGDITEQAWLVEDVSPTGVLREIMAAAPSALTVHINSYGGDTSAGIAIYNSLRGLSIPVTTVTDGFACSAASLIFMAGKSRIMKQSSLLMIHNAWTCAQGNADELRKTADDLEKISATAAKIYSENCALMEDEIKELLDNESWITPEEALEWGFATGIEQDESDGGRSHSSAFRCIKQKLTVDRRELFPEPTEEEKAAPVAEPESAAEKPEEEPPAPIEDQTPFQRFFGKLN